jgi:hypothetical protein
MNDLRIGIVGLDSSHPPAFAQVLNGSPKREPQVTGGRIVAAWPGDPSLDFDLSVGRIATVTEQFVHEFQIPCVASIDDLRDECDAVIIACVDSRQRLEQLALVASWGKPVFVDKPLALSVSNARAMLQLAHEYGFAIGSSSAHRFSPTLLHAIDVIGQPTRADLTGPLPEQSVLPWLFWYGVHQVEVLYRILGPGCTTVRAVQNAGCIVVSGRWTDGRVGTFAGSRARSSAMFGVVSRDGEGESFVSEVGPDQFAAQVSDMLRLFREPVDRSREVELLEVVAFLEAAQSSLLSEKEVSM